MKHIATINAEFVKLAKTWWEGQKFRHPQTRHLVNFKSLPIEEQRRLNALHKKQLKKDERLERKKQRLQRRKDRALRKKERLKRKSEKAKLKKQKRLERAKTKIVTPATHPNFFTKDGVRLNTTRGIRLDRPVNYNPAWSKDNDNAFYAWQPTPTKKNKEHRDYYYTVNYMKKTNREKFAKNKRFGELLPGIRTKYNNGLSSQDERTKIYCTAIALVDQCACRIGNKGSEEVDNVRGLHNLQVQHMKIIDNKVELSYPGKKKVDQHHEFTVDETIKKNLMELIKDKSKKDPIFTWTKRDKLIRIAPRQVNRFLRYKLKSPVTVHHFRHFHGTRIANEYLSDIDPAKFSKSAIKRAVDDAAIRVAVFLGNTKGVAKKHYIDPAVFESFYKRAGLKMKKAANTEDDVVKENKFDFQFGVVSDPKTSESETNFTDWMSNLKLEELDEYRINDDE